MSSLNSRDARLSSLLTLPEMPSRSAIILVFMSNESVAMYVVCSASYLADASRSEAKLIVDNASRTSWIASRSSRMYRASSSASELICELRCTR